MCSVCKVIVTGAVGRVNWPRLWSLDGENLALFRTGHCYILTKLPFGFWTFRYYLFQCSFQFLLTCLSLLEQFLLYFEDEFIFSHSIYLYWSPCSWRKGFFCFLQKAALIRSLAPCVSFFLSLSPLTPLLLPPSLFLFFFSQKSFPLSSVDIVWLLNSYSKVLASKIIIPSFVRVRQIHLHTFLGDEGKYPHAFHSGSHRRRSKNN